MVIIAIMIGAGVLMEICAILGAPHGYQDEAGFHICNQTVADEDSRLSNPS